MPEVPLLQLMQSVALPTDSAGMVRMATGIGTYEGWIPTDRAWKNNSPGDFRWPVGNKYLASLGAVSRDANGFAQFPDKATGCKALLQFLRDARSNQLIAYRLHARALGRAGSMCTLGDFFGVYAPASDKNVPSRYAQFEATFIGSGVTVETPINQI